MLKVARRAGAKIDLEHEPCRSTPALTPIPGVVDEHADRFVGRSRNVAALAEHPGGTDDIRDRRGAPLESPDEADDLDVGRRRGPNHIVCLVPR